MPDKDEAEFQKSVQKTVDAWFKDVNRLHLDIADLCTQIDACEDDAKGKDLMKQRLTLASDFDKRSKELELKLKALPVPESMEEKAMKKLPTIVQETIKKKGIPLAENLVLKPSVDIDFKAKKIKEASLTLEWKF